MAQAELEAQYKPSPRNTQKVAEARADAAYEVAKEKCDDLKGNEKDVCEKDAKAARVKAKAGRQGGRCAAKPADNPAEKAADVAQARKDANAEKNDANYQAAKERCDAAVGQRQVGLCGRHQAHVRQGLITASAQFSAQRPALAGLFACAGGICLTCINTRCQGGF